MQYWLYLVSAIVLEVAGTTSMKLSEGFSKIVPSIFVFVFYTTSFGALAMTMKKFEVSMVYAVWSGAGTVLITAIGIMYFRESISVFKVFSILLIIIGVVGLNLSGTKH
jgi:small multidrug resistance pump